MAAQRVQRRRNGGASNARNDARNAFGALGDVFLILGKFSVAPITPVTLV